MKLSLPYNLRVFPGAFGAGSVAVGGEMISPSFYDRDHCRSIIVGVDVGSVTSSDATKLSIVLKLLHGDMEDGSDMAPIEDIFIPLPDASGIEENAVVQVCADLVACKRYIQPVLTLEAPEDDASASIEVKGGALVLGDGRDMPL